MSISSLTIPPLISLKLLLVSDAQFINSHAHQQEVHVKFKTPLHLNFTILWKSPYILTQYVQLKQQPKINIAGLLFTTFITLKLNQRLRLKEPSVMAPKKMPSVPGFTAHSDQVFVREADQSDKAPADHPDVVMIYGWGDGLPKHVSKYAEGYLGLFPYAKQIVVLSPIQKAFNSDLQQRSDSMLPVIKAVFPSGEEAPKKILAHTMSNTGAVNYAAMLNAYQQLYNTPCPHQLLVMDSTPGGTNFWANLSRWSRAMALGTAGWFPWPFAVTQGIWAVWLMVNGFYEALIGRESAGGWSSKAVNDGQYEVDGARRLYMYSKEDDLIHWGDIEEHAALSRKLGREADVEVFEGSGHVGHMRMHGEQYWNSILASWKRAIASEL